MKHILERVVRSYFVFCVRRFGSAVFFDQTYSYNEHGRTGSRLKNFSIEKDWDYIIPAIQKAQSYRPDIKFFAAPWRRRHG